MAASLEETLISVWRQVLVEEVRTVTLESGSYPVGCTSRSKLCQVDFRFENQMLRGLEQNPNTGSRWAELARAGKKVMQFLDRGRYVANVVDGPRRVLSTAGPLPRSFRPTWLPLQEQTAEPGRHPDRTLRQRLRLGAVPAHQRRREAASAARSSRAAAQLRRQPSVARSSRYAIC